MTKIAVVTDSTAYLKKGEAEELGVYVVPLSVSFGNENFRELEEITTEEFFVRVRESEKLPTSSQPAAGEFIELYENLAADFDAIISIHISSGISGTFQTVSSIANTIEGVKIYPVDSTITSVPQTWLIREAVKMSKQGAEPEEIIDRFNLMKEYFDEYFVIDDLTNLVKGGRISKTVGDLGSLLNIKPILTFKEGKIVQFEKIRTLKKATRRMEALFDQALKNSDYPLKLSVVHVYNEEAGTRWKEKLEKKYPDVNIELSYMGPVVGVHMGEKSSGLTWSIDFDKLDK